MGVNNYNPEKEEQKRLIKFIAIVVTVIAVIVTLIFVFVPKESKEPEIKSTIKISAQEKLEVEELSKTIINKVGNFGIRSDKLNGDNARNVEYVITQSPNNAKELSTSRQNAYESINENIMKNSPLAYSPRIVAEWVNESEMDGLISYKVDSATAVANDTGSTITVDDKQLKSVTVKVTFSSTETVRQATANDTSWDGSFTILEKTFGNNTADLIFVKDNDNEWKAYALRNLDNQFLLATWETPASDSFADTQLGFNVVGKLEPTDKLKDPSK